MMEIDKIQQTVDNELVTCRVGRHSWITVVSREQTEHETTDFKK